MDLVQYSDYKYLQTLVQYKQDLVCHLQIDEKSTPGQLLSTDFDLNVEMVSAHDRKTVKCSICNATFTRNSSLNRHVASVHEGKKPHDSKKPFKCDICNSTFTRKSNLKTHSASVHDGKKLFDCDICNTTFTQKKSLKEHEDSVHDRKKMFKCDICSATFTRKYSVKKHTNSVHAIKKT